MKKTFMYWPVCDSTSISWSWVRFVSAMGEVPSCASDRSGQVGSGQIRSDQVDDGEQDDPDEVDEVPVQADELDRAVVVPRIRPGQGRVQGDAGQHHDA